MEKIFALIKDNKVFNTIAATQDVIDKIGFEKLKADLVIDITGTEYGIGCILDAAANKLNKPKKEDPPVIISVTESFGVLE